MTELQLAGLPLLLRREQVMSILGLSKSKYYDFVKQHPEHVVRLPGGKELRVAKRSLLSLLRNS